MLRALLITSILLMPTACRRDDGKAARAQRRDRSARVELLDTMLHDLEKLGRRGQNVEAGCRALRHQLDPLRVKSNERSSEILMRYHRLCTRARPNRR